MARIRIALGNDMRYFEPTLIAMLSVLRSTPEPITVHLFGLNLSDYAWQRFEAAARSRSAVMRPAGCRSVRRFPCFQEASA